MRKIPDGKRAWLMKELPILESAGVLTREKACDLRRYYEANTRNGVHWAVTAFAVLGSLLISSGIILLFAHNWEDLSRPLRALLSVCPLAVGALLSLAALAKNGETAWRESAGLFHALAIGASIALIGQTYHLPSDIPAFLLTWALLILPLMFLLRATGAGLIYLALVCAWSAAAQQTYGQAAAFWLLILPPAARTVHLLRTNRHGAETLLHLVGLLLALYAGTGIVFERTVPGLWIVAYAALLSTTGLLGLSLYGDRDGWSNCPKIFGVIGMAALAYLFTWSGMWQEIGWEHVRHGWQYRPWGIWLDGGITLAFLAGWAAAALRAFRRDSVETVMLALFPAIAILCFANGSMTEHANTANALIFNAFMLSLGIMYMVLGCRNAKLRQLNGGMGILSLLLLTRFFDTGFTYIARGIVFIVLGTIFLSVNLVMARRKKNRKGPAHE